MAALYGWKYFREITIDASNIDADLTQFPLTLHIDSSSGITAVDLIDIFTELGANSKKIAIFQSDKETQLYVEIEQWDAINEIAILHISRPDWIIDNGSDTKIYLAYDSNKADNTTYITDVPGDSICENIWDSDFVAVWHLKESGNGTANEYKDSSGNARHGTGASLHYPDQVNAKVGKGQDFDNTNSEVIGCGDIDIASTITVEAIVNAGSAAPGIYESIFCKADSYNLMQRQTDGKPQFEVKLGGNWEYMFGVSALSAGTYYYLAGKYDGSAVKLFKNGLLDDGLNSNPASGSLDQNSNATQIGSNTSLSRYFDGILDEIRLSSSARTDAWIKATYYSLYDALVSWGSRQEGQHKVTILSDAQVLLQKQETILSDAIIISGVQQTIISNAHIKVFGTQQNIISDAHIVYRTSLLSDAHIQKLGNQEVILSDAEIVEPILEDVNNKFNIIKQITANISNKFNLVIRVLSDINSYFNMVIRSFSNISNDFRMKKQTLNNIANDIRFLKSWLVPGDAGFQSLGKSYIKVYIDGVEQTDVDVDSINIFKTGNTEHTASFNLGRAYDSTRPTPESFVEIKYHVWTLYTGYVVLVTPGDEPETININCKDEYWKQNKSNVYFHVGHAPQDEKELYYETIKLALNSELGWNLDIGNFVPQTIDCFAIGKSEALNRLISECGNYEWFYDVDGTKKLIIPESGNIINIQRQVLGTNIGLFQLLSHQFTEDASEIINKYRVQLGDKVIRTFNTTGGSRQYTGYNYSNFQGYLTPNWNRNYERIATPGGSVYGINYPDPDFTNEYSKVGKVWNIPYLDTEISSWSDRYPPYIEIRESGNIYGAATGIIRDGFTIDFEKRQVTFNEPILLYYTNQYGEVTKVRAPRLKLFVFKKNYYTVTEDPTDNPEEDISNPLMFFTDKVGTYPTTILKDLNLSDLSIQVGGNYIDEDGNLQVIPSWDDTEFARDYAYWLLSNTKEKKITGRVVLTLDNICYNAINLTKRIFINGITDIAMNIKSINYDMANFTVTLELENLQYYRRSVSLPSRGE